MKYVGTKDIKTKRLLLRRFKFEDVEAAYNNYGSDAKVNQYISFAPCSTRESTEKFIRTHTEKYETDLDFYGWAVTLDDVVVGSVGLFNIDENAESCEVGASLGSK